MINIIISITYVKGLGKILYKPVNTQTCVQCVQLGGHQMFEVGDFLIYFIFNALFTLKETSSAVIAVHCLWKSRC